MRSPIPIEPRHSISNGHHDQQHMSRGSVRTYDDDVAQHGAHIGQPMHNNNLLTPLQFDIRDPFYGQLTAVKTKHRMTTSRALEDRIRI